MRPRRFAVAALALALAVPGFAQGGTPGVTPDAPTDAVPEASEGEATSDAPSDDDVFAEGAFDAAAGSDAGTESAAPNPAGAADSPLTTDPPLTAGGLVAASVSVNASASEEGYLALGGIAGKVFAKAVTADRGFLYAAANVRYVFANAASGSSFAAFPAADYGELSLDLAECYWAFDVGKAVFVRAGKQLVAWGASKIWSPADFVNRERADPFAAVDARVGAPSLRVHVPFARANLFAFADFTDTVDDMGFAGDLVEHTNVALRADAAIAGGEYGLTAYGGRYAQWRFALDASARLLGFSVYGEAAAAPAYGSFDAWFAASAGLSRTLDELGRWRLSAEGYYGSRGEDLTGNYVPGTYTPLYAGAFYAYAALDADKVPVDFLKTGLSGIANLSDRSWKATVTLSADPAGAPPFTFSLSYSGGGDGKEFTTPWGDGTVACSLRAVMEF